MTEQYFTGFHSVIFGNFINFLFVGAAAYFGAYMRQRGTNAATKRDIDELTRKVEGIKLENAVVLESFKGRFMLRGVAADKRLETYQKAFMLWYRLRFDIHKPESRHIILQECEDWWIQNCLYLSPKASITFRKAYFAARGYVRIEERREFNELPVDAERLVKYDDDIRAFAEVLEEDLDLPPLKDIECEFNL